MRHWEGTKCRGAAGFNKAQVRGRHLDKQRDKKRHQSLIRKHHHTSLRPVLEPGTERALGTFNSARAKCSQCGSLAAADQLCVINLANVMVKRTRCRAGRQGPGAQLCPLGVV